MADVSGRDFETGYLLGVCGDGICDETRKLKYMGISKQELLDTKIQLAIA